MGGKPKLAELLKKVGTKKVAKKKAATKKSGTENKKYRNHRNDLSDSLDIEMIRKWIPHLIACNFDRERSLVLAFPGRKMSRYQKRNLATSLIKNPYFTDTIAAHLDTIDTGMGSSELYVLNKLYRQAEANIFDYFTVDEHGQLHIVPLHELPKWMQQNVKKLKLTNKVVETGLSRKMIEQTIDLEIVDSFKPVALLGKNMGMFIERIEVDFGKQTADRLQAALERVKQKRLGVDENGHQQPKDKHGAPRTLQ